ncbi:uncharacterized protein NECHADRAFT_43464 [Fusarium vanettenii 77-13-4]|uniref:Ubiquitin-like domain-containing protein n=1 Tax=Fusarium vanettenii (strain ATCC MYA-4622 / CBS 123669 / FGSC 9596 / NRRL 45880 / 77-13-4) TaxID=660122 RepID=C7ZAD6_FUSV7|nr:uncharacterized protein NECHADRAFT_43464 [Fusarium vanettenii 77-13-4]EEU39257.1 hypothetical protein NECHADRAFT_43464 [Fusarium vanettenii 77-13-4]
MLLDITGQLKRIIRAIEAIPLHLTLDIVRLDDAHGESWALPLQACQTWNSFSDMLRLVVYANERPGANLIMRNQFSIMVAQNGMELNEGVWGRFVNTLCGRWATTQTTTALLMDPYTEESRGTATNHTRETGKAHLGPKLPPMQVEEEPEAFRKVKLYQASQPMEDIDEALELLDKDTLNPAANAFAGFTFLREGEELADGGLVQASKQHLEIAVKSDALNYEYWYLLGRACICFIKNLTHLQYDCCNRQHDDAVDCFQRCIARNPQLPEVHARLRAQPIIKSTSDSEVLKGHLISTMCDSKLRMSQDTSLEAGGDEIVINPISDMRVLDEDDDSDEYDDNEYDDNEYYDDEYGDDECGDDEDSDDDWRWPWTQLVESSVLEPMT